MSRSKLLSLVELLPLDMYAKVEAFLCSPFFNKDKVLVCIFRWYAKYKKDDPETLLAALKPDFSLSVGSLKNKRSRLCSLLQRCIAQLEFEREAIWKDLFLAKGLNALRDEELFNGYFEAAAKRLENRPLDDVSALHSFLLRMESLKHRIRQQEAPLAVSETALNHLEVHFRINQKKLEAAIHNHRLLDAAGGDPVNLGPKPGYRDLPSYRIYEIALQLEKGEHPAKDALYFQLKALLISGKPHPDPEIGNERFTFAINHCLRRINQGETAFLQEYLELHIAMQKQGLYESGDYLAHGHLKNLILLGLRMKGIDWVERVYANTGLEDEFVEGVIHFQRERFEEAAKCFHRVKKRPPNKYYLISSNAYLIKVYVEMEDWEAMQNMTNAFKQFLRRRQDIPDQYKIGYLNFVRFTQRLSNSLPGTKKYLRTQKELAKEAVVAGKGWLSRKFA